MALIHSIKLKYMEGGKSAWLITVIYKTEASLNIQIVGNERMAGITLFLVFLPKVQVSQSCCVAGTERGISWLSRKSNLFSIDSGSYVERGLFRTAHHLHIFPCARP